MDSRTEFRYFVAGSTKEESGVPAWKESIQAFFYTLNEILFHQNIVLYLYDAPKSDEIGSQSNRMYQGGTQLQYDEKIKTSDFFYVLVNREMGKYTVGEFDCAYETFSQTGNLPWIYTCFFSGDGGEEEDSVRQFKERLRSLKHYYNIFSHIDTIKLNMLVELERMVSDPKLREAKGLGFGKTLSVRFCRGRVILNGAELDAREINLLNVPMYREYPGREEMARTIARLERRMEELNELLSQGVNSENAAKRERRLLQRDLDMLRRTMGEQEREIQRFFLVLVKWKRHMGDAGPELIKAIGEIEAGDYTGALETLRPYGEQNEAASDRILRNELRLLLLRAIQETAGREYGECWEENRRLRKMEPDKRNFPPEKESKVPLWLKLYLAPRWKIWCLAAAGILVFVAAVVLAVLLARAAKEISGLETALQAAEAEATYWKSLANGTTVPVSSSNSSGTGVMLGIAFLGGLFLSSIFSAGGSKK